MNRRLQNWLLSLYPRRWRDRYGPEVGSLTDELIDAGETTPLRAGFDLTFSAATERGRALGERWRALGRRRVLAMATAFAMLLVLGFALTGHQVMRGSSAIAIDCQGNFTKVVSGQPPGEVTGRLIRVQAQVRDPARSKFVVGVVKGMCGPPGFGCLARLPVRAKLRVVAGLKPRGPARLAQVLPPPGPQWTVNMPAMARQCAMSVHAKAGSVREYKPGPPPQQKKKRVPQQSKK